MNLIEEVRRKKQFAELPDSVVKRALDKSGNDVKGARSLLRKYFGVFLSNKVLKGVDESVLKSHLSSKNRDYDLVYSKIFEKVGLVGSIFDLGCGVNPLSYEFIRKYFGDVYYVGVEGVGQLVDVGNDYFEEKGLDNLCYVLHEDLLDFDVGDFLKKMNKTRVVFMFQIVDALEFFEKDFSKKFLLEVSRNSEFFVLSFALKSLSGKKKFDVSRKWLLGFIEDNFEILEDFQNNNERFLILKNKK